MDLPPESSSAKDPTPQTTTDPARAAALFEQSVAIMARLRAPGGCPWDREQSFDSIRKYTLEEAYEVFDAIERRDFAHLTEELGDLLLQVLFYAEMAANEGHFTIADVLDHLNRKLVRRHPHVFGDEASRAAGNRADVDAEVEGSAAAVLRNWEEIKAAERAAEQPAGKVDGDRSGVEWDQTASRLDGVLRALPALAEAAKLGAKAQKSGFDWPSWRDLLPKMAEETAELEAEAASGDPARKPAVEAELGDLLFTVVNLGRHLGVDAEMALRNCNLRFRRRFSEMERASPRPLEDLSPTNWKRLWAQAKKKLAGGGVRCCAIRHSRDRRRSHDRYSLLHGIGGDGGVRPAPDRDLGLRRKRRHSSQDFLLAQKIGGQVIGAFDSDLATRCAPGRRPGTLVGFAMSLPGMKATPEGRSLISTRTCWRSAPRTATAALARNSNGSNGVRRFRAASGTWSGRSIRWKSKTLFSISTGWAPSRATTA